MTAIALLSLIAAAPAYQYDFYAAKPYEAGVPTPDKILGYSVGARHTTYRDQERVVLGIAEKAGKRVQAFEYGKSWEGRPLRVFAISSPANMARLNEIRGEIKQLATGKGDASAITKKAPAIVWINQCIHGDETASFESAMPLLYNLAASNHPRIRKALDNTVVILNPVYNPDGHERYVVWYNSVAVGSAEPDSYEARVPAINAGRQNHYRFDMNRDRISMTQVESYQEVAEFLKWNPQVYVDQHGQTDNYFFPPNPMSINANVDRQRINLWTDVFGKATAKSFDERGWMYYIKDIFDLYYPGYLDSWTSLSGAIGMTHETDGGRYLATTRADGTVLTMLEGAAKHFESALAVIESAASRKEELLLSYAKFKREAVTGTHAGSFKRVVVSGTPKELKRLSVWLNRHGLEYGYASAAWTQADATDYWSGEKASQTFPAGSLVIDMAQPQGQLAKALFEPESAFEEEFMKRQLESEGGGEFYDLTGWSLPFVHGLQAWHCASTPKVDLKDAANIPAGGLDGKSSIGYYLAYEDQDDVLALAEILAAGVKGISAENPMELGDQKLAAGTFLFMAGRNQPGYEETLEKIAKKRSVTIQPLKSAYPTSDRYSPGSESNRVLKPTRIAALFGAPGSSNGFGFFWYLMEQEFRLPFTPLTSLNNLSRFSCVVVPGGTTITPVLREWVQGGGSLVVLGNPGWALGSSGFANLSGKNADRPIPGTLFRANLSGDSFLTRGYADRPIAVPVEGSGFYKANDESAVTILGSAKLSGWTWPDSEEALTETAWAHVASSGRGNVTIFTQDPTERTLYPGLHKLLLNAMILGAG